MDRNLKMLAMMSLAVILVVAFGCGGGDKAKDDTRAADIEVLKGKKEALDAKRTELAASQAALMMAEEAEDADEEPAAEGEEGEGGEPAVDPAAQVEQLEAEVVAMGDDLMTSVVDFINSDPPLQGEPFNEYQAAAIRLKSAEDMVVADEYISQGGDYRRAIRIYEDALVVDPDNPELQARLASSQELRYMTEERFALATKDMAQDQVREVLGQVNLRNIREYEDKGVISWFYTKENGGAAGVHFRERKGEWRVYQADFNAVEAPEEREAE